MCLCRYITKSPSFYSREIYLNSRFNKFIWNIIERDIEKKEKKKTKSLDLLFINKANKMLASASFFTNILHTLEEEVA